MNKKIINKLLAILMIIMILTTDFFVLGSSLVAYAVQLNNETSNDNIGFSVYFKKGESRVDSIDTSIKNQDLKLYAEIIVNSEDGYLDRGTTIEISNSNFNIASSSIGIVEGNKITLNQAIDKANPLEIELGIEPIIADKITTDFLSKTSTVKLGSTYKYSEAEEGETIYAEKEVSVNYQPDESTEIEYDTDIITNKVLAVNGTNKRVVQIWLKTRLTENQYPVEKTIIKLNYPTLGEQVPEPESVNILALGKLATNGAKQISDSDWKKGNGEIEITLNNIVNTKNEISWSKNAYDELIVTFLYPEEVSASKVSVGLGIEMATYGSTNTYTKMLAMGTGMLQDRNKIIYTTPEITTPEIYKGQLYANISATEKKEVSYDTVTKLVVTTADIADEVVLHEGRDVFETSETELVANIKYVSTEINKDKMLEILGQDGNIEIRSGEKSTLINKDSQVNENGNIVINHEDGTTELDFTTSGIVKTGVLEIKHTKVIGENDYIREQLKEIKSIKTKNSVVGIITVNKEKINVVENSAEASFELKETISKAELTVDRENLSTTEANEVTLGVKLITDGVQYDLFKNPTIKIQLPAAVENVELIEKPSKLYADKFEIHADYDSTNKIIIINLVGEQTAYPESSATQLYLQLKLNITLSRIATTQTDKITMTYINENASQYVGETTEAGIVEQQIGISAPTGLLKVFDLKSNENTSLTEAIIQRIENEDAGKIFDFETMIVNNTESDISNVRIFGKLPTTGNGTNTLETTLKSIVAPNATIYYTENVNATTDTEDTTNGWTTNLETLTNAKLYLIKLETLSKASNYTATFSTQMTDSIVGNLTSYAEYEVIYDTVTQNDVTELSRKIGLTTSIVAGLETELTAVVGQETLKNGDTVKEGEVIKYIATAKNNGKENLQNLQFKLPVPEGTVLIGEKEDYVYANGYYDEKADTEVVETFNLEPGQTHTVQYEVRVKTDIENGTEISNKATIIYSDSEMNTNEIKNTVSEANIRVTIKRGNDKEIQFIAGSEITYVAYVENLSNEKISDLTMRICSDNIRVISVQKSGSDIQYGDNITEVAIAEIPANGMVILDLNAVISEEAERVDTYMTVTDSKQVVYRSNGLTEILPYANAKITMTSPQNNANIKEGDTVEYNIIVENTGSISGKVNIKDEISEYLRVEALYVNGKVIRQITDETNQETYQESIENDILHTEVLEVGQKLQLDIICKVAYSSSEIKLDITNKAEVEFLTVPMDSAEVTHILIDSAPVQEISGLVWLDENEDGQIGDEEVLLKEVTLKLYDISTNNYLTDENGNIVQTVTNIYGEFTFSNVNKGSYIIVVEYDTEKYDLTTKSNVKLQNLNINGETVTVVGTDTININDSVTDINIGLKEKGEKTTEPEEPTTPTDPEKPTEPEEPTTPTDPEDPTKPTDQENPTDPEEPTEPEKPTDPTKPEDPAEPEKPKDTKSISGFAWLDEDRDGQKDAGERALSGIKVRLYRVSTKNYLMDDSGNIVETITNNNGEYIFNEIEKDSYIVLFDYDTQEYEPTAYLAANVETSKNSKAIIKTININGEELTLAVTDVINVQDDVSNINIGLKENLIFDLELDKYISKIVVQNSKETKSYDYENKTFAKVEIHRKQVQGSLVVLEYTIKLKNNGEIAGYAKNIIDYLPTGLTFSSELNKDWYISGNNLYTKGLENVAINPGEEKEVKLILTKTMTNENTGLINNRAEIYQDYNKYGEVDIDSTPNNQAQGEDDTGSADVIIGISTGGGTMLYTILLIINMILIGMAIKLMIKNKIIRIPNKMGRR